MGLVSGISSSVCFDVLPQQTYLCELNFETTCLDFFNVFSLRNILGST